MVVIRQCFERRMRASSFLANRTIWRSGVRVCGMLLVVCLLFVLTLQGFFGQKNTSTGPSPPVAYLRDSLSLFSACQWNEVAPQPKRRRTGDAFCEGKSLERVTKADVGGGGPWAPDDGATSAKKKRSARQSPERPLADKNLQRSQKSLNSESLRGVGWTWPLRSLTKKNNKTCSAITGNAEGPGSRHGHRHRRSRRHRRHGSRRHRGSHHGHGRGRDHGRAAGGAS
mmetsp:Transcript_18479/g.57329  ORF Transcript_18479/g.57329 Transcript_18479/m.57329 type:complete len:227 (-) Transcript_18479:1512-2192(-)